VAVAVVEWQWVAVAVAVAVGVGGGSGWVAVAVDRWIGGSCRVAVQWIGGSSAEWQMAGVAVEVVAVTRDIQRQQWQWQRWQQLAVRGTWQF
jgi:hypothetical protein